MGPARETVAVLCRFVDFGRRNVRWQRQSEHAHWRRPLLSNAGCQGRYCQAAVYHLPSRLNRCGLVSDTVTAPMRRPSERRAHPVPRCGVGRYVGSRTASVLIPLFRCYRLRSSISFCVPCKRCCIARLPRCAYEVLTPQRYSVRIRRIRPPGPCHNCAIADSSHAAPVATRQPLSITS
jgi:hypothetical protein